MIVGLTTGLDRLVQVRRNRLLSLNQAPETSYVDDERVKAELAFARRIFADNGWPVIDVTRRSIEETAAAVIKLVADRAGCPPSPSPRRAAGGRPCCAPPGSPLKRRPRLSPKRRCPPRSPHPANPPPTPPPPCPRPTPPRTP